MIDASVPLLVSSSAVAPGSGSRPVLLAAAVVIALILAVTVWMIRPGTNRARPVRRRRPARDTAQRYGGPSAGPSSRTEPDPMVLVNVLRVVAAQAPSTSLKRQIDLVLFNPEHTQAQLVQAAISALDQLGSGSDESRTHLLMGLRSVGVEEIRVDAGERLDTARHQVIDIEHAPEPHLHNTVARAVRPGFRHRGQLLRTPGVIAYQHQPA